MRVATSRSSRESSRRQKLTTAMSCPRRSTPRLRGSGSASRNSPMRSARRSTTGTGASTRNGFDADRSAMLLTPYLALAFAVILAAAPGAIRSGKIEQLQIRSKHQAKARRVWDYTPPGYSAARDTSLGMMLVFDGSEYLDAIPMPRMLDSLIAAHRIPPLVTVLLDDESGVTRLDDLANRAWFVSFIGNELVPWVRARWHVSRDPKD